MTTEESPPSLGDLFEGSPSMVSHWNCIDAALAFDRALRIAQERLRSIRVNGPMALDMGTELAPVVKSLTEDENLTVRQGLSHLAMKCYVSESAIAEMDQAVERSRVHAAMYQHASNTDIEQASAALSEVERSFEGFIFDRMRKEDELTEANKEASAYAQMPKRGFNKPSDLSVRVTR